MKSTLEKITPEPAAVKKLPFPKLVKGVYGNVVLMSKEGHGVVIYQAETHWTVGIHLKSWANDANWQDLAPDECVKLTN